jgi:hypothetical protein
MAPVDWHVPVRKSHARALLILTATTALWVFAATRAPAISPKDRRLENARTGISVEAPAGWTLSQHTGYADTIALLLHPDGCRISVTAAATTARDARALFEQNRPGLVAEGMLPSPPGAGPRGSLAVDLGVAEGRAGDPSEKVRQLYLVRGVPGGRQAVILTLVCRPTAFPARVSALDFVATRLELDDPLPPRSASASIAGGTGGTGATGATGGRRGTGTGGGAPAL